MKVEAYVEPIESGGYRVSNATIGVTLVAPTKEDAIAQFREAIHQRCNLGGEIVSFEIPPVEHPLKRFAGIMRGNPMIEEWRQAIAEHRKQVDAESSES